MEEIFSRRGGCEGQVWKKCLSGGAGVVDRYGGNVQQEGQVWRTDGGNV